MAHVELQLMAHRAVRLVDGARVASEPGNVERSHPPLEPALASIVAQGPAERARLSPCLQVSHPLAQSRRLAMNGILKTLHELLQVGDPGLERTQRILPGSARRRLGALIGIGENATKLPDSGDQALTFAHAHRRPLRFRCVATGG